MELSQSIIENFAKTQTSNKTPYVIPGDYELEVMSCKNYSSEQTGKTFFIVEFTVLKSNNPERPEGSLMSWHVNYAHKPALKNIKEFIKAASNMEPPKEAITNVPSQANPLKGAVVKCYASQIKTRANTDFTKTTWRHVKAPMAGAKA